MKTLITLLVLICTTACFAQDADTIYYKNGNKLLATYIGQNDTAYEVKISRVKSFIDKSIVERIGKFEADFTSPSLKTEEAHYKHISTAGGLGVTGMTLGLVGSAFTAVGVVKGNKPLTYAGIAFSSASFPFLISSFAELIKSSKH